MRILFVSRCLPLPLHRGDRLILYHLLRGLRGRGHRCEVVALAGAEDGAAIRAESAALADGLEVVAERARSPLAYLARAAAPFPVTPARRWHPAMGEAVARRLAGAGADIVHFFGGIQVYEHRDAARGRPRVIQPYESHALWLTRAIAAAPSPVERVRLRARRLATRHFERRIYAGFDRVLLNAEPDERQLRSLAPSLPTAVIPQGVEVPATVTPLAERRGAAMVFVGNLAYGPNRAAACTLAAEILPRVRDRVPEVRLALVGAEPPDEVLRLASDRIEVTGLVPDVRPWLARAAVFVSPLAWGAGAKNKVLEAMAAGTPVVATPQSCDGIAVHDGEHVLLAATPAALAAAAVRVLTDAPLAGSLAVAARALVERHHVWPLVIGRYETLYDEVSAGSRDR